MEYKRVEKRREHSSELSSNATKLSSGILGLFLVLFVGGLLFFPFYKIISSFQRLLYQRTEETLIGSSNIAIGIFALVIGADFFVVDFLYKLAGKYYPDFYRKYYFDPHGSLKINKKAFKKFKIALVGLFIFGIFTTYFFFNEYLSLGSKYIAASSMSFVHNRKEYDYSEIQINKIPNKDSGDDWIYKYIFPDGKELSNIGFFPENTIKLIQNAQRKTAINISTPYTRMTGKGMSTQTKFFGYLIWAAMFLFIPWTLGKLFKREK